ncbi:tyrosine-type recombinase/integrase [uncultured Jatrophihabitans sp.]|uniref:tyrosine-type recombinase/integrase n=1 Tax=uncultured Jatrophihabitans sp. TaxID=1610747 RepID=UPI0035C9A606
MASLAKRADGHWRARYRDAAGNEHSRHFKRKVDAQRWLDEVTTAVTTGMYVDPGRSQITVGDWAQRWIETKVNLKPSTHARYEGLLRVSVLPRWKNVKLVDVTHEGVAAWVASLTKKGLAPATVRQAHRVFSLALTLAVRDGRLARNPADHVPLPRLVKREKTFLTMDQADELADAAGDYRTVILFLAYTGVRIGELSGLRVRRLDLMRRRAEIVEAVAEVGGKAVFSSPKSHQVRSVPIPRFLVDDLAQLISGKAPEDFVFTSRKDGLLRLTNFRPTIFDPAVRAAGLDGLTPHGLRHTAASLAITSGADVKVVQQMLGHASATMTLDLYGHLYGNRLDEVADRMDALRSARKLPEDAEILPFPASGD